MDVLSLLRTFGALGLVLGFLTASLWAVRRFDIRLPGQASSGGRRRLQVVERLTIDGRRSAALLSRDGREHLILFAPEGNLVIESDIAPRRKRASRSPAPIPTQPIALGFAAMVERASRAVRHGLDAGTRRAAPARETQAAGGQGAVEMLDA